MKSILSQGSSEHTYAYPQPLKPIRSGLLYLFLLVAVITSLLALPWIQIESITTSPGVIAPPAKPFQIKAQATGQLNLLPLPENRFVQEGDTLFSIRSEKIAKEAFTIAPIDGYVRILGHEQTLSRVQSGEVILEVQPEPDLVVTCYLSGDDIASIRPQQHVEFQIHSAQNKTREFLSGKVDGVYPSICREDEKAPFEVRCRINADERKSRGTELKAGMTLLTRFRLARRTAFDIILKDVEDKDQSPS